MVPCTRARAHTVRTSARARSPRSSSLSAGGPERGAVRPGTDDSTGCEVSIRPATRRAETRTRGEALLAAYGLFLGCLLRGRRGRAERSEEPGRASRIVHAAVAVLGLRPSDSEQVERPRFGTSGTLAGAGACCRPRGTLLLGNSEFPVCLVFLCSTHLSCSTDSIVAGKKLANFS